jgi:maltooligosyltrehalose synthase
VARQSDEKAKQALGALLEHLSRCAREVEGLDKLAEKTLGLAPEECARQVARACMENAQITALVRRGHFRLSGWRLGDRPKLRRLREEL